MAGSKALWPWEIPLDLSLHILYNTDEGSGMKIALQSLIDQAPPQPELEDMPIPA